VRVNERLQAGRDGKVSDGGILMRDAPIISYSSRRKKYHVHN